ncbi:MAG: hypothetical protein LBH22_09325 [Bacteroidales bacterium]|nr:hypothetical protein [Bacteroidales bacterium]
MNPTLLNCSIMTGCLEISWLWYSIALVIVFFLGWAWYNAFTKRWVAAVKYGKCACGADMAKGEKCTCKPTASAFFPMIVQLLATALIGFMYFVLVPFGICLAILVAIAVMGWMKSSIIFQTPEWRFRVDRILIDVGYFFITSAIFIGFALI